MIDKLKEILEEEEIYVASLVEAANQVDSSVKDKLVSRAEGIKLYHKRISERIEKEILNGECDCTN